MSDGVRNIFSKEVLKNCWVFVLRQLWHLCFSVYDAEIHLYKKRSFGHFFGIARAFNLIVLGPPSLITVHEGKMESCYAFSSRIFSVRS